ncbi:MAG: DUF2303 family protein [Niveispirillum sp.]|uniref:DUF2303 family protein n=1 Tax=Niveispirillum sp. TaxID=1917217 RepID=UPI003BA527A3
MTPTMADMQALITAIQAMQGPNEMVDITTVMEGSTTLLITPDGRKVQDVGTYLDKYLPRPRSLSEDAILGSTTAMVDYTRRFHTADSCLFVNPNPDTPWLKLIVDYHTPATTLDGDDDSTPDERMPPAPAHCRHRATYNFPLSDEMREWRAAEKAGLVEQEAFAWLLQKRQNDISNPPVNWMMLPEAELHRICDLLNLRDDHQPRDGQGNPIPFDQLESDIDRDREELPAGYRTRLDKLRAKRFGTQQQLLTLSTEMAVRTASSSKQSIRLQDGTHFLEFSEDNEAHVKGQKVKVPELFLIDIPIFDGEETHLMPVRLYYRRTGQGIKWQIELVDHRRMLKSAIVKAAEQVAAATGVPLINGNPFAKGS